MIRFLLLGCLCLGSCTAPQQIAAPASAPVDSTIAVAAAPAPPVELLRVGDVLFDREPPPFPDSALADSIRNVYQAFLTANPSSDHTALALIVRTEAYALDSLGQETPVADVMREAAAGIPDSAKAFVFFTAAWDGTPVRAEVAHVTGDVPSAVVRKAAAHIYFRPTWFENGPDIPRGTPIPFSTRFSIPFSQSWLD